MPATYRVLMSDELWALRADLVWPEGLGLTDTPPEPSGHHPGWSVVEVHDEHAPDVLDGRLVDLVLTAHAGARPTVRARVPVDA